MGSIEEHGGTFECIAKSIGPYGQIFSVRADRDGVIVGTSRGLYSVVYRNGSSALKQLLGVPGPVVATLRDRDGNIWAGTWGQGLYRKNASGVERWSSRDGLADDFVRQLYEDRQGNLWVGLRGGAIPLERSVSGALRHARGVTGRLR